MKKHKYKFSIKNVGRFRFVSSIVVGLTFSLILNKFFLYLFKIIHHLSFILNKDDYPLVSQHSTCYNYLFWSLFSTSLAFSFTMYLWTSKPHLKNKRATRINRMAQTNSLFIFGIIFLSIARLVQFYIEFHYVVGYKIKEELRYWPFIIPLFIYCYHWNYILRIYKSTTIFIISIPILIVYALILSLIENTNNNLIYWQ